jgi:hypothetical protein
MKRFMLVGEEFLIHAENESDSGEGAGIIN